MYAVYVWQYHDQYHSAFEKLILLKNGRYNYTSYHPFSNKEYSEGSYAITKTTLTLNNDFQPGNLPVKIDYIDTSNTDTLFKKLNFARNMKGKIIYSSYYSIDTDTSDRTAFFPNYLFDMFLIQRRFSRIKLCFDNEGFTSAWTPVLQNNKFIQVTILSDKDFDEYKNKVFADVKFTIKKNKLIPLATN